jgi:hypothetical protein
MQNILNSDKRNRIQESVVAFGCVAFAIGLIAYGIMGTFMRYSGNDYRYGQQITSHGFLKTQWNSYFNANKPG